MKMSFLLWCLNYYHMFHDIWRDVLRSRVARIRTLNPECHIQALHNLPKKIIRSCQCLVICRTNEELTAVGICAGIGHGYAANIVRARYLFIVELIAWRTRDGSGGVACLDDKSRDNTVEDQPIIEMM